MKKVQPLTLAWLGVTDRQPAPIRLPKRLLKPYFEVRSAADARKFDETVSRVDCLMRLDASVMDWPNVPPEEGIDILEVTLKRNSPPESERKLLVEVLSSAISLEHVLICLRCPNQGFYLGLCDAGNTLLSDFLFETDLRPMPCRLSPDALPASPKALWRHFVTALTPTRENTVMTQIAAVRKQRRGKRSFAAKLGLA